MQEPIYADTIARWGKNDCGGRVQYILKAFIDAFCMHMSFVANSTGAGHIFLYRNNFLFILRLCVTFDENNVKLKYYKL